MDCYYQKNYLVDGNKPGLEWRGTIDRTTSSSIRKKPSTSRLLDTIRRGISVLGETAFRVHNIAGMD